MARDRYVVIFANTQREATIYARRKGIRQGYYRFASSAGSILGVQCADIHVLPSFEKRRDKHAIRATIRYARDVKYLDAEMPEPVETPAVDQGDGMGEQLTIEALDAVSSKRGEETREAQPSEDTAPPTPSRPRRPARKPAQPRVEVPVAQPAQIAMFD